jgi:hypothetical protein
MQQDAEIQVQVQSNVVSYHAVAVCIRIYF